MINYLSKIQFSKLFKEEDSRFLLVCGFKFSGFYLISALFIYYAMWLILSLNSVYFESKNIGFTPELRDVFLTNALAVIYTKLPEILSFFIVLFFAGGFLGKILMRPFEVIGHYCTERTLGRSIEYNPDIFSDYKLLTRFGEFFFSYLDDQMSKKTLNSNSIPSKFLKIHGPSFERVFFFHFMVLVSIIAVTTGLFIAYLTTEVRSSLVDLSIKMISVKDPTVGYFMENQFYIFNSIIEVSSLIIFVSYLTLSFHLYSKVSGAIFGFFSTMRSFMKGNFKARVHLIGYAHIRPHGRALNKYLDHVERECTIDHNNVKSKIELKNKVDSKH